MSDRFPTIPPLDSFVATLEEDTNLLTPDEKAALAGTFGHPDVGNRYVTDTDPRLVGGVGSPGPAGPAGADGAPGEEGQDGMPGPPGGQGEPGAPGTPGGAGTPGADGRSGTIGSDGADGEQGEWGLPGAQGIQGIQGSAGTPGSAGVAGAPGQMGLPGMDGVDGIDGIDVWPGPQGTPGPQGSAGAVGPAGQTGRPGLDGRDADDPEMPLLIPGPAGPQGPAGAPGGGGINLLRTTGNQTINAGAATFVDITGLTFPVVSGTRYAFDFYITFRSANVNTGWKAGVNCPAGTLDFWAGSDIIANGAAGVATHTERHNVVRDDMTLLTATVTANVDLNVRIRGRYLCTANGTFAARFANELAADTNIVVQAGSWGFWF